MYATSHRARSATQLSEQAHLAKDSAAETAEAGTAGSAAVCDIRIPKMIEEILRSGARDTPDVAMSQNELGTCSATFLPRAGAQGAMLELAVNEDAGHWVGETVSLRFEMFRVVFVCVTDVVSHGPGTVALAFPECISTLGHRRNSRIALAEGLGRLVWTAEEDELIAEASISDFSASGARVRLLDRQTPMPPRGEFVAEVQIAGVRVRCLAESKHIDEGGREVGIVLRSIDGTSIDLADVYHRTRFPELQRRRDASPEAIRALMVSSGYMDLRDATSISDSWLAAKWDDSVSADMVYADRAGNPIGHISTTRAYSKTWFGHQLATVATHREAVECRHALYAHAANWALLCDPDALVVSYFDRQKPWHKKAFEAFTDWLGAPSDAAIFELERFERKADSAEVSASPPEGYGIAPLEADSHETAVSIIASYLPNLAQEAFDISAKLLTGRLLPNSAGIQPRERHGFVLRDASGVVGVALCETGDANLSVFNLLNMAQLYFKNDGNRPSKQAQAALLAEVRRFYRARGIANPIVVAPPGSLDEDAAEDSFVAERMGCIVWTAGGLRQYDNFVNLQFGLRNSKTAAIRSRIETKRSAANG